MNKAVKMFNKTQSSLNVHILIEKKYHQNQTKHLENRYTVITIVPLATNNKHSDYRNCHQ